MEIKNAVILFALVLPFTGYADSTPSSDLPIHFLGTIGEEQSTIEVVDGQNKWVKKAPELQLSLRRIGDKVEGEYGHKGVHPMIGFGGRLSGQINAQGQFTLTTANQKRKDGTLKGKWEDNKITGTWVNQYGSYPFSLVELQKPESEWLKDLAPNYRGVIGKKINILFKIKNSSDAQNLSGIYKYVSKAGLLNWSAKLSSKTGLIEIIEKDDLGKVTGTWKGKILKQAGMAQLVGIWTNPKTGKSLPFSLSASRDDPFNYLNHTQGLHILTVNKGNIGKGCSASLEYDQIVDWPEKEGMEKLNSFLKSEAESGCENSDSATSKIQSFLSGRYVIASNSQESSGGAHPDFGRGCAVFDLKAGNRITLSKYFKPNIEKQLNVEVKKSMGDDGESDDAESGGFMTGAVTTFSDSEICPDGHGLTFLDHNVPYSTGGGEVDVSIEGPAWKTFFQSNDVTRAIFGN